MAERRLDFMARFDWIRHSLMFEPRGHDMMSGIFFYPPDDASCDIGILFIETSGCLPMCGHGTIGAVTVAIQEKLVTPRVPGELTISVPAGTIRVRYEQDIRGRVTSVSITNIPSFLYAEGLAVECPDLGLLKVDVAYGGNFYAIIDPQPGYRDMADYSAAQLIRWSPVIRERLNAEHTFVHPEHPEIKGLSHILWTGAPTHPDSTARNAVFYGEKAIDRSPCGTGTSARMAQWHANGKLHPGDAFIHESIIGSIFKGMITETLEVGSFPAIRPQIQGWAVVTGYNTIIVDTEEDPFAGGFTVK